MPIYTDGTIKYQIRPRENGHSIPHIHALYAGKAVSIAFDGTILEGGLGRKTAKAVAYVVANSDFFRKEWNKYHV